MSADQTITREVPTNTNTNAPATTDKAVLLEQIKEAVFVRKPVLREIFEKCGHKSLLQYAQDYFDVNIGEGLPALIKSKVARQKTTMPPMTITYGASFFIIKNK
jgi:hypothetical protein